LRNFEQRISDLRKEKRQTAELQTYYERLHEIYASLDEPDGMEGVSTFVISPSLEHQIREHESTGRWTSAQSCWEVRLQQSPEDLNLHQGLLRCLRNLGHYGELVLGGADPDTLRTHIRGILSRHPHWAPSLSSFEAEAAWIMGDWSTVRSIADQGHPMARVMAGLQRRDLGDSIQQARLEIGRQITSTQYNRVYEPILQLHVLRELEEIESASKQLDRSSRTARIHRELHRSLDLRFDYTAPTFRTREAILSARRTAFAVLKSPAFQPDIGKAWVSSSKMARKAGYDQTAYSAVLQAREVDASFAFVQQAKLSRTRGGALKALTELENSLTPLLQAVVNPDMSADEQFARDRNMAKASKDAALLISGCSPSGSMDARV
jgi:serine/threonine-protein kinase ATR